MQKLQWKNLLDERCPKCECKLWDDYKTNKYKCALYGIGGVFGCDFKIGKEQLASLQEKLIKQGLEDFEIDNADELNNLSK